MSGLWLPAATALGALTLTYLCCVRPMWRAHRAAAGRRTPDPAGTDVTGVGPFRPELTALADDPGPADPRTARGG